MHNKGIIRFLEYAKMEQKPPLRNKSNSVDANTYIKTGQVQRVLMVLYNTFVLLQKLTHFVAIVTFSFVTIQLLTTSNLPVQWFAMLFRVHQKERTLSQTLRPCCPALCLKNNTSVVQYLKYKMFRQKTTCT